VKGATPKGLAYSAKATHQFRAAAAHLLRRVVQYQETQEATGQTWGPKTPIDHTNLMDHAEFEALVSPLYDTMVRALDNQANPMVSLTLPEQFDEAGYTGPAYVALAKKQCLTPRLACAGLDAGLDADVLWEAVCHMREATDLMEILCDSLVDGQIPGTFLKQHGTREVRWLFGRHSDHPVSLELWQALRAHCPDWTVLLGPSQEPWRYSVGQTGSFPHTNAIALEIGMKKMDDGLWRDWLDALESAGVDLLAPVAPDLTGVNALPRLPYLTPNSLLPLFERGVSPNLGVAEKDPLLHRAFLKENLQQVQELIAAGADITALNEAGQGPLHALFVERFGNYSWEDRRTPSLPFLEGLRAAGFDPLVTNEQGELAFEGKGDPGMETRMSIDTLLTRQRLDGIGHDPVVAARPGRRL
jgi:hypothetical protein